MIDEEITYREKGYRSSDLKPNSYKPVWAVCQGENCERVGGRGRWLAFYQYRDLCADCARKKPRLQKYETSNDKLEWIDDEKTYNEKGYRSTDLKPNSHKEVWRTCSGCGEERWISYRDCSELCNKCSKKTDEFRKQKSESRKGKLASDETKKLMSDGRKGEKNGMYDKKHTEKAKELIGDAERGEKNHNWRGGVSFEPYCEKFNEAFKEEIREKFGRVCFMDSTTEEENGRKLDVHHVNYDKDCICNGVECEFVPLCRSCHSKTNGDRELWERLIINVLYYEGWIE